MASFEEDQAKIADIRAKLLGQNLTKADADAKTNDYFANKVIPIQTKALGTEKAVKATEDGDITKYYDTTVANIRKKEVGG